jgi:hypothetical protein
VNNRNRRLKELVSLPIVAVIGFALATVFAGVSVAEVVTTTTSTTTSTTSTTTTTTTTTPTTTTTTPPPGNEGCTPGFWKTHPGDYPTGYSPSTTLGSVFTGLSPTYAALTLDEALSLGGGGLKALLRHAAAALLNAASDDVDYSYTTAEVVAMTNAAIASRAYEATKDVFDSANNGGAAGFCD